MAVLINKKDMATSLGISVQAFDKWGVIPTEKRGRVVFYDVQLGAGKSSGSSGTETTT